MSVKNQKTVSRNLSTFENYYYAHNSFKVCFATYGTTTPPIRRAKFKFKYLYYLKIL